MNSKPTAKASMNWCPDNSEQTRWPPPCLEARKLTNGARATFCGGSPSEQDAPGPSTEFRRTTKRASESPPPGLQHPMAGDARLKALSEHARQDDGGILAIKAAGAQRKARTVAAQGSPGRGAAVHPGTPAGRDYARPPGAARPSMPTMPASSSCVLEPHGGGPTARQSVTGEQTADMRRVVELGKDRGKQAAQLSDTAYPDRQAARSKGVYSSPRFREGYRVTHNPAADTGAWRS